MPKTESINVCIAPKLKAQVEILLKQMALTTSEVITLFFKQVARRREIPFPILAYAPNAETIVAIEGDNQLIKKMNQGDIVGFALAQDIFDSIGVWLNVSGNLRRSV